MKSLLSILFFLSCLTLSAQQVGDKTISRTLESVGDTAYYVLDTILIYNQLGQYDVSANKVLYGDSTETGNTLHDLAFPAMNEVSSALTKALQFSNAVRQVSLIAPLITQLTGLNIFRYTADKFGESLIGNYKVRQENGTIFDADILKLENGTLRLVRASDNANWVVRAYGRNMFMLMDFDEGGTVGGDYLFNFYKQVSGMIQYLPVEEITGETSQLIIVKIQ